MTTLRGNRELIPGLLAVGVFLAWAAGEGGYPPTSMYPGALFILGLLVVTVVGFRAEIRDLSRPSAIALALLAAFALWSFVAILWADDKAVAWEGANRTMLYVTIFALFALPRWRPSSAAIVLGTYSVGLAVVGAVIVLGLSGSSDPGLSFIDDRLAEPAGYANATAALFAAASFPTLFLASRREVPWPARGLALAAAGVLVQYALIPQSRGALIVYPIALLLYIAFVPSRVRSLLVVAAVAAATALAAPTLLDVFESASGDGGVVAAIDDAAHAMALSAVALFVVGAILGMVDGRVSVPDRTSRLAERGVVVAGAVCAIVGIVLFLGTLGSPVTWAGDRWDDLKAEHGGVSGSRLSGDLGSDRYDFWRVGVSDEFASAPVQGKGTDSFAITYTRERRSADEEPVYPHSTPVQILAGTGLIGGILFGGFLGFAIAAAVRIRRRGAAFARATSAAAIVTFAYWFLHSCGDWLWAFAGLAGPAIAWLALGGRIEAEARPDRPATTGSRPWRSTRALTLGIAVAGVLMVGIAAASYYLPWAAARDVETAKSTWRSDPVGAFDLLDRARQLNFLSSEPDAVAGSIAEQLGEPKRMQASFERALERQPDSWFALLELGALDALEGRTQLALSRLRRAVKLNPRDALIRTALHRAKERHPLALERIDTALLKRLCATVGRTHDTRFCR